MHPFCLDYSKCKYYFELDFSKVIIEINSTCFILADNSNHIKLLVQAPIHNLRILKEQFEAIILRFLEHFANRKQSA